MGWWLFAKNVWKWALRKEPVPWPAAVQVGEDFRLLSLPARIGPFRLAEDGELTNRGQKDGHPDGDHIFPEHVKEALGLGTGWDEARRPKRRSNWYMSRTYRDTRVDDIRAAYATWRIDITYYTGGLDTLPHIPDVCLEQSGAAVVGTTRIPVRVPSARSGWDGEIEINRTRYEMLREGGLIREPWSQYYIFSLNGNPESDWKVVRWELTKPWVRYCYFAKIQFLPINAVRDPIEGDQKAEDFLNVVLPRVLEVLPTQSDVDRCGSGEE
jgi:hypothetical protein